MNETSPIAASRFPAAEDRRDRAIVLVHGAWVGEWCWEPMLPLLEASGRRVIAVSLTGHGARSAESGPHITLDDHVQDVVGVLNALDLSRVTVAAHSYGGRVITRAWPLIAHRVEHMVYLDAHAPLVPPPAPVVGDEPDLEQMVPFAGFDPDPAEFGGQASVDWFMERIVPHSLRTLHSDFMVDLPDDLQKTYLFANGDQGSRFAAYAAAAAAHDAWAYHEVSGSHWVMMTHPDRVAKIILGEQ